VKVTTTRFGELELDKNDVLNFPEGILGFEHLNRFFIVDPGDSTLILWLQSIDDGSVAFPIIEPKIFKPDYIAKLLPADLASIELENATEAKIYSVLTIPGDITQMSANLKAPVVINNAKRIAKQVVLQDSKLSVNYEMYRELKKYIVGYSSDDSKRTNVEISEETTQEVSTDSSSSTPTAREKEAE
jgi:flagellar assembly factor FliW